LMDAKTERLCNWLILWSCVALTIQFWLLGYKFAFLDTTVISWEYTFIPGMAAYLIYIVGSLYGRILFRCAPALHDLTSVEMLIWYIASSLFVCLVLLALHLENPPRTPNYPWAICFNLGITSLVVVCRYVSILFGLGPMRPPSATTNKKQQ
jgi:hypothetical protein